MKKNSAKAQVRSAAKTRSAAKSPEMRAKLRSAAVKATMNAARKAGRKKQAKEPKRTMPLRILKIQRIRRSPSLQTV